MSRIACALVVGLHCLAVAGCYRPDRAVARVDESWFHWGEVLCGEAVTHTFTLWNDGGTPLHVLDVRSSCSCTVAEYDETIAPGSAGYVKVVVDTSVLSGAESKNVTVETNDPERPRVRLTLQGIALDWFDLRPPRPQVEGFPDQLVSGRVVIEAKDANRFELRSTDERPDDIGVRLTPLEAARLYALDVSAVIPEKDRVKKDYLEFLATFPDGRELPVSIRLVRKTLDRVVARPANMLVFHRADTAKLCEGTPISKSILLESSRPEVAFSLDGHRLEENEESLFDVHVRELEPNHRYQIDVTLTKAADRPLARSSLFLELSGAGVEDVDYRLMALFGEP